MAAYQTLMRLEKEWTALVEARNVPELLKAMRYVYNEWQTPRYIGISGLSLLPKAELVRMVVVNGGGDPSEAKKAEIVKIVDDMHHRQQTEKRAELKTLIAQLEASEIPAGLVETMIYTLDMAW